MIQFKKPLMRRSAFLIQYENEPFTHAKQLIKLMTFIEHEPSYPALPRQVVLNLDTQGELQQAV